MFAAMTFYFQNLIIAVIFVSRQLGQGMPIRADNFERLPARCDQLGFHGLHTSFYFQLNFSENGRLSYLIA
jgi:hypothetical protein